MGAAATAIAARAENYLTRMFTPECAPGIPTKQKRKEHQMPLINVKTMEGVFTPKQKQEMIQKFTDVMVSIEGESMRPVTLVIIEEVKSGDWSIGGKAFSTADVKALAGRTS
jgi:4-oxalocrotonate tautomerase